MHTSRYLFSNAEEKTTRLAKLGITKEKVLETLSHPEKVELGYRGRKIAQHTLDHRLVLRVISEERDKNILVITIYSGVIQVYRNGLLDRRVTGEARHAHPKKILAGQEKSSDEYVFSL